MPTNTPGPTNAVQPLDTAIAAAAVGPLIFALEAIIIFQIEFEQFAKHEAD